ncbi:hypothetical protein [Hymenobacter sp. GOD-10R]|uniref:hypothetical protein n=1 Tax=Hymenobacter sp. GOD-10R TaxID=3093922 RepID=UPI002D792DCE|nr:hypothetical protein [Hymenobacter sp. GOD-10R]WRQ31006.1 hypothetical protein SD425_12120 [Hymenobacter sp. GOD-10R]
MKSYWYMLMLLATMVVGNGCQKNDEVGRDCAINTSVTGQANQYEGYVHFVTEEQRYAIVYHIPGTYDSQIYGVVCALSEEFRQEGKKVKFSGTYKEYNGPAKPVFGGQEYRYLELKTIEAL